MSGQGNYLGSIEDIANIITLITEKDKIGVCLDTAHLYQNGYDLNNDYNNTINMIDKIIGLHYVKAIHINDSLTEFQSDVDRHAFIGEGYINLQVYKNSK